MDTTQKLQILIEAQKIGNGDAEAAAGMEKLVKTVERSKKELASSTEENKKLTATTKDGWKVRELSLAQLREESSRLEDALVARKKSLDAIEKESGFLKDLTGTQKMSAESMRQGTVETMLSGRQLSQYGGHVQRTAMLLNRFGIINKETAMIMMTAGRTAMQTGRSMSMLGGGASGAGSAAAQMAELSLSVSAAGMAFTGATLAAGGFLVMAAKAAMVKKDWDESFKREGAGSEEDFRSRVKGKSQRDITKATKEEAAGPTGTFAGKLMAGSLFGYYREYQAIKKAQAESAEASQDALKSFEKTDAVLASMGMKGMKMRDVVAMTTEHVVFMRNQFEEASKYVQATAYSSEVMSSNMKSLTLLQGMDKRESDFGRSEAGRAAGETERKLRHKVELASIQEDTKAKKDAERELAEFQKSEADRIAKVKQDQAAEEVSRIQKRLELAAKASNEEGDQVIKLQAMQKAAAARVFDVEQGLGAPNERGEFDAQKTGELKQAQSELDQINGQLKEAQSAREASAQAVNNQNIALKEALQTQNQINISSKAEAQNTKSKVDDEIKLKALKEKTIDPFKLGAKAAKILSGPDPRTGFGKAVEAAYESQKGLGRNKLDVNLVVNGKVIATIPYDGVNKSQEVSTNASVAAGT